MKKTLTLLLVIAGVLLFITCKKRPELKVSAIDDNNIVDSLIIDTVPIISLPVVITHEVIGISTTVVVCGGDITDDGGAEITARGVCWSTYPNPTIDGQHTNDGFGAGSYSSYITDLNDYTPYYIRAYATNEVGTAYGEQKTFPTIPDGAIAALFSISDTKRVFFSQGNLQYKATTNTWRFSEHQYDYVGEGNSNLYEDWIDLFGWGTSGYNHGAVCYQPWSTSILNSDYYAYGSANLDLNHITGKADWGYNAISNGGNVENKWRTLTKDEWTYLCVSRTTISGIRYAKAQVNEVNGFIILPDNWETDIYNLNKTNAANANFETNVISESDWANILEANGAVFLPAAGWRNGTTLINVGTTGYYSSATRRTGYNDSYTCNIIFSGSSFSYSNMFNRYGGQSVRLVCDVE